VTVNGNVVQKAFVHLGMAAETVNLPTAVAEVAETTAEAGHTHTPAAATPTPGQAETPGTPAQASSQPSICIEPAASSTGVSPGIQVTDQEIVDNTIHIDNVVSVGPGWIAIWTQPEGADPAAIGYQQVQDGANQNVSVTVDSSKATANMLAVLHHDGGQQGLFEQDKDCVVFVGLQTITAAFATTGTSTAVQPDSLPLSVLVDDQPLRGGDTLIIAEVVSDGPGWIGIHLSEANGELSHTAAIGASQLVDGLNTNVVVKINNPGRATEKLWGMLHYDREPIGEYDYPTAPSNDEPALVNGEHVVDDFLVTGGEAGQKVILNVASSNGVSYLVDAQGFSLYTPIFGDCTDAECLKIWRPMISTGGAVPGTGVNGQNISVQGRGDGSRQVTYAGLALYYFVGDGKQGDTNGHLQDEGRWVLVQP
jgi:predicted lipoprotein with Yx(FWY)xxD motif